MISHRITDLDSSKIYYWCYPVQLELHYFQRSSTKEGNNQKKSLGKAKQTQGNFARSQNLLFRKSLSLPDDWNRLPSAKNKQTAREKHEQGCSTGSSQPGIKGDHSMGSAFTIPLCSPTIIERMGRSKVLVTVSTGSLKKDLTMVHLKDEPDIGLETSLQFKSESHPQ